MCWNAKNGTVPIGNTGMNYVSFKMYEQIYGSEIYIYEKFGHAAYEEATDFNKRVFDYLKDEQDHYMINPELDDIVDE